MTEVDENVFPVIILTYIRTFENFQNCNSNSLQRIWYFRYITYAKKCQYSLYLIQFKIGHKCIMASREK